MNRATEVQAAVVLSSSRCPACSKSSSLAHGIAARQPVCIAGGIIRSSLPQTSSVGKLQ